MSLMLDDRVRETTQTTGTGTITLDGAVQGFQSFAVIGNNNTTYYTINRGSEWEVGLGTYYGGTLSRDTIYASSNSGNKVNFSAGAKDVFVTYPAEKSVNKDANNRVLIPYTSGTTNVGSLNVGDATAHTDSGVIAGFTASEPLYLYTSLQNTSASNTSYASYAVNDGGHTAYGELGINNSNYSYSAAGYPNNGFSTPLATFVESYGGPLVLGSWDNQKISMIINGAVSTTDAMTINTDGSVAFNGQVGTAGQILQSNATSAPTWVTPSGGTVTSVTGTAPVVSSGGATPAISMAAATASVNGYLTSTDWTTFNNKGSGTVTSVGGTGTVNGLSLSGTVTSSGNLTFGGTLDLSSPPAIGGTAAAAGTFTTLIGGGGSANYEQITGGAAGKAVQFQSLGSDAAVSLAIQSKGTGAIDLAAGSSGVNISNGGTVTAITETSIGYNYTTGFPLISITAPTTAGGVQATATVSMRIYISNGPTLVAAGSGYAVGNVLTLVGGTSTIPATLTVATVDGSGAILTFSVTNAGNYTALPGVNPVTTTVSPSGGTGATFNVFWRTNNYTITAAGSGYVEQPTISFSGGNGVAAVAYATVGSGTTVKGLGSTISFTVPSGELLRLNDSGVATPAYLQLDASATAINYRASGAGAAIAQNFVSKGTAASAFTFSTNTTIGTYQFMVSHTASAVNYVQVTGGVTGNPATVTASAQGSDANVNMRLTPKGTGTLLTATAATILDGTAIPAGGTAGAGYKLSSTANFGIFFGSGAPTLSAAKGSLYMRSDGSSIATRMYINTDGSTTWTNVVTAA